MTSAEIRQKFLDFFASPEHGSHAVVPSSSLIPDDPSVLLTTAGMQQFKPYFIGERDAKKDFDSLSTASCQKSFRTSDIDEVGDERHLTFFEMLGNFSFGGYFKKEAIAYAHEFITKEMGLAISYVTIFEGKDDIGVPRDTESEAIWQSLDPNIKIIAQGMDDVFWGPTGSSGPCGPTTEIYCKNDAMDEPVEVWNIVFNQFFYPGSREELLSGTPGKKLEPLKTPGVDTGMGLERLVMVKQGVKNIFETDLFKPLIESLKKNNSDGIEDVSEAIKGIIIDHARAIVFLVNDGLLPSNKDAGYILRRLMRRYIFRMYSIGSFSQPLEEIIDSYKKSYYSELDRERILPIFEAELSKFLKTLTTGLGELYKMESVDTESAFRLYQSYGLPYEVIKDYGKEKARGLTREGFDAAFKKHQEVSRAGSESKFGGHGLLLDTGEIKAKDEHELKIVTRLHTATHMLQQALRDVLGPEVKQAGSDITAERTRFDFTFGRKLTPEELKKVEDRVNEKIQENLPVAFAEMPRAEAEKTGALYFFKAKYGDRVKVYYMGSDVASAWSKEFCGGPHVSHTSEVGKFKIAKEEAVSAGVRRIRGIVA